MRYASSSKTTRVNVNGSPYTRRNKLLCRSILILVLVLPGYRAWLSAQEEYDIPTRLGSPSFTVQPKYSSTGIALELHHELPDAIIHYTTDGSVPDESSMVYSEPLQLTYRGAAPNRFAMIRPTPVEGDSAGYGWIAPSYPLDKGHIIRAIAALPGYAPSPVASGTWFPGTAEHDLPVLSIMASPKELFGSDRGLYVPGALYDSLGFGPDLWGRPHANHFQRGRDWEREVSIEWCEEGRGLFQHHIGVRIHGGGSRALPLKSLRLYARSDYGRNRFRHLIFPDRPYSVYNRLILRNSGQDFYNRATMLRDAFMQRLISGLNVQTQAYRPVVIYLNGEYWGIHNLRERYDKHFFERVYEVPGEHLDYLERRHVVKEGTDDHYVEMLAYTDQHGLSEPEHMAHLAGMMDLENYTDYLISNIFLRNRDWPGNNIEYWRYSGPPNPHIAEQDGRWRWVVFDLDYGFALSGGHGSWKFDMISFVTDPKGPTYANRLWATFLIRSLLESDQWREQFVLRFSDLLNTTFLPMNTMALIDTMAGVIRPEMDRHIARWSYPPSLDVWEQNIELMKEFARKRPGYQIEHLRRHFDLQPPQWVEIGIPRVGTGSVRINSLDIFPHPDGHSVNTGNQEHRHYFTENHCRSVWRGRYFPDIPLHLQAFPAAGYQFSHWDINGENIYAVQTEFQLSGDTIIHPHFEPVDDSTEALPEAFVLHDSSAYAFDE